MARTVWRQAEWEAHLREQIVGGLDAVGREAKSFVIRETPHRTGYAQRSIYYVVLDPSGAVVAGDAVDGNGVPVPTQFPGTGQYRVIVGANAPYYVWIEIGANGRPGHQALARALELIDARIAQGTREARATG